jgi:hypothetical protein
MRAFGDGEAEVAPDLHDFFPHLAHGVDRAGPDGPDGQRDVHRFGRQARLDGLVLEQFGAFGDCRGHGLLQRVECRAGALAFLGRQRAQALHALRDRALLAQRAHPHRLEARLVARLATAPRTSASRLARSSPSLIADLLG